MLRILLPTDFSSNAENAIAYAVYLLEKEQCTFYLLHAYHDAPSSPTTKLETENDLKRLAGALISKNNNSKHSFKTLVEKDSLINLLNRTVINEQADFVFMGTKGSSSLTNVLLGSSTLDAIKQLVPCPIIAIPKDYDYDIPEEILFASDYKHMFKPAELMGLIKLSKLWDSRVTVLHIHTETELDESQKQNKGILEKNLGNHRVNFVETPMYDTITATLFQYKQENPEVGILSILKTKHGYFQSLLRENVLKNITLNTKVPLLVLPMTE